MKYLLYVVLLCCGALACGPSFQALYECDVRFEHCYSVDQSAATSDAKRNCWRDWLHGYTYGQSRDRVEYAATRFGQLSLDVAPGLAVAPHAVAAPMPTNAFSPPPNVADGRDGGDGVATGSASSAPSEPSSGATAKQATHGVLGAPGAQCTEGCAQLWSTCHGQCKDEGCEFCNQGYRTCVPACFGGEASGAHPASRSVR